VIVHPAWLNGVLQAFEEPGVMAVTGPVLPAELETEAQFCFSKATQLRWGYRPLLFGADFFAYTQRNGAPVWRIGAGANIAFRRECLRSRCL
jgi:hypothetical protein